MGDYWGNLDIGLDLAEPEEVLSQSREPEVTLVPEVLAPSNKVDLWPSRLPMEIALCSTVDEEYAVAEKFNLQPSEFTRVKSMPAFRKAVNEMQITLREDGYTFKQKCRGIAEDFLGDLDIALHNPQHGITTKLDIFKTITKLGDLEPKQSKTSEAAGNTGPTVNIQINI